MCACMYVPYVLGKGSKKDGRGFQPLALLCTVKLSRGFPLAVADDLFSLELIPYSF